MRSATAHIEWTLAISHDVGNGVTRTWKFKSMSELLEFAADQALANDILTARVKELESK